MCINHLGIGQFVMPALAPVVEYDPDKTDEQRERRNPIADKAHEGPAKRQLTAIPADNF